MSNLVIGIVGPCASGKSTLIEGLKKHGYYGKHIAQEHSYVPDMWKRITNPDILIYLDVSYEASMLRKNLNWSKHEFYVQIQRLEHAKHHADLTIHTETLTPENVLEEVLKFIRKREMKQNR